MSVEDFMPSLSSVSVKWCDVIGKSSNELEIRQISHRRWIMTHALPLGTYRSVKCSFLRIHKFLLHINFISLDIELISSHDLFHGSYWLLGEELVEVPDSQTSL